MYDCLFIFKPEAESVTNFLVYVHSCLKTIQAFCFIATNIVPQLIVSFYLIVSSLSDTFVLVPIIHPREAFYFLAGYLYLPSSPSYIREDL